MEKKGLYEEREESADGKGGTGTQQRGAVGEFEIKETLPLTSNAVTTGQMSRFMVYGRMVCWSDGVFEG